MKPTPFKLWLSSDEVLRLLDYPAYFDLLVQPLPANRDGILEALANDSLIRTCDAGGWNITNLGAILFAKKLREFPLLKRKALRVIQYRGTGRIETLKEQEGGKGYACGFEGLIGYINGLLPANEVIEQALCKSVPIFPELAVRELVANALIHQDFFQTGTGPMVVETIDMDSYRSEKQATMKILLADDDAEIEPIPVGGGGRKPEPELEHLSTIIKSFNEQFSTLFTDVDRVSKRIQEDIAPKVAADQAYQNAKLNTPDTARLEHDKALTRVMLTLLKDDAETYKQFVQNDSFKRYVSDMVFKMTYESYIPKEARI